MAGLTGCLVCFCIFGFGVGVGVGAGVGFITLLSGFMSWHQGLPLGAKVVFTGSVTFLLCSFIFWPLFLFSMVSDLVLLRSSEAVAPGWFAVAGRTKHPTLAACRPYAHLRERDPMPDGAA